MRIKSFYAKTMTEAMQMVRDMLGEDAVIVDTREDSGAVHVTAAIEPGYETQHDGMSEDEAREWLQYDSEEDEGQIAEELTDVLLRHSVSEDVTDHIVSCATVAGLDNPYTAMVAALEHLFTFRPLPKNPSQAPIIMIGTAGSGKTLSVAKATARGVMNGLSVGVVTCDTVRAGGVEQLEAFTKLMKVNLRKAKDAKELSRTLDDMLDYDQVFIDTPGLNPYDKNHIKLAAQLIEATQGTAVMVLGAGQDSEESAEAAKTFSDLGVDRILPTRIDAARRLGGILSAAHHGGLSLSDAGNTPKVADGLVTLSPESLTQFLMPSFRVPRETPRARTGTGH